MQPDDVTRAERSRAAIKRIYPYRSQISLGRKSPGGIRAGSRSTRSQPLLFSLVAHSVSPRENGRGPQAAADVSNAPSQATTYPRSENSSDAETLLILTVRQSCCCTS